ncbi:hypothetical protein BBJ28_00025633 [Nothophytophthora sp. Chile5]|nr:hypothetical protein BBJ28_00025633 [Nothophytophthora sp. Chile5]
MKAAQRRRHCQRVPLRGFERTATMADGVSTKLVHSMLVRGDTTTLQRYLPSAVMCAFNTHPRMRVLQVQNERFMAEVQPPITQRAVLMDALLRIRVISSAASDANDMATGWQQYADDECSIGFDRYKQLPFFLTVWVDEQAGSARLMLFSDHYMSDGYSGMVVLNCVLEQVALLARQGFEASQDEPEPEQPPQQVHAFPLRPSLYKMWLTKVAWAKPIVKSAIKLSGRQIFRDTTRKFTPLLPARADQHEFRAPPATSSTTALFAQGNASCMQNVLAKCEEEGVTFSGALVGVLLLAFYHVTKERQSNPRHECFKVAVDLGYNMRQRVPHPAEEEQVGMFTTVTDLEWLTGEGVDMKATGFWDFARRAKREMEARLKHTLAMALPAMMMDTKINSQMDPSFLKDVQLPHSLTSDVNLANVGRYPFAREHHLFPEDDDGEQSNEGDVITVESLHVYHPLPHLAPSATLFVSSVGSFSYSMAHKCENVVGEALFEATVALCEGIDSIGTDEKLIDVLDRVGLRYTGHFYT